MCDSYIKTEKHLQLPPLPKNFKCGKVIDWDLENFQNRPCPTCHEDNSQIIVVRPDGLPVHRCQNCGMYYLAKVPSPKQLDNFYSDYGEYKGYVKQKISHKQLPLRKLVSLSYQLPFIRILDKFGGIRGKKICEIGSAYGRFLQVARFKGGMCSAVELDDKARIHLDKLGFPNYKNFEEIEDKPDIICAKSVFEHLISPETLLKEFHIKGAENSLLLISVPNGGNIDIIGKTWAGLRVDFEHLNYWSVHTLCEMLVNHNWFVEQYWEYNQLAISPAQSTFGPISSRINNLLESARISWDPVLSGNATLAVLARRIS